MTSIGSVALGCGGFDLVRLDSGTAPVQTLGSFTSFEQPVQVSRLAGNGAGLVYQGQQPGSSGVDVDAGLVPAHSPLAFTAGYRRSTLLQRHDDGAEVGMRLRF